jgi:hypothetical protein
MSSAIDYLKQEEAKGRVDLVIRSREVVNAVRDAKFWAEVNRIRETGGWRAEEQRISLGNGTLTVEQQAELDREAMELIKVRKELLEKKKQEEQQKKEDEKRVRELLLSEPALSWKMRVSPNNENMQFWPEHPSAAGYSHYPKWDPNEQGKSAKEILDAYAEIQEFRASSMPFIKEAIKKTIAPYWDESDEMLLQRDAIQISGGNAWHCDNIKHALGISYTKNIDTDYWKTIILNEIAGPLYSEEWQKWYFYAQKFIERSKGKPRLDETLKTVKHLEEKIESLKKRNEFLEEKINSIRSITHF